MNARNCHSVEYTALIILEKGGRCVQYFKRICLIMISVLVVSGITGCHEDKAPPIETEEASVSEVRPAKVIIDYLNEGTKEEYETYDKYVDPKYKDSELMVYLFMRTNLTIRDVKIYSVEIEHKAEADQSFIINEEVYHKEKLTPERPLIYGTVFPGLLPNLVISYTDADDMTKTVSVAMSGEDGSLVVQPAVLEGN